MSIAPATRIVRTYELTTLVNDYLRYTSRVAGNADSTVNSRRYILKHFIGYLYSRQITDIAELDIYTVDEYLLDRADELVLSSLNQVKQAIRNFLWFLKYHKKIKLNVEYTLVKRAKETPSKVRTFTHEEIAQVIKNADNEQDKLMIAVMFESGVRIGELVKITVEDIYDTEIRIRGKGSYDRTVYITSDLARKIRRHTIENRIFSGCIFRHQINFNHLTHDNYKPGSARDRIQRQFERVGIKMVPHQLRHSFSINWLLNGGDLRTLQKILGHSSLEVTQRYLQTTDRFTKDAYHGLITKTVFQ